MCGAQKIVYLLMEGKKLERLRREIVLEKETAVERNGSVSVSFFDTVRRLYSGVRSRTNCVDTLQYNMLTPRFLLQPHTAQGPSFEGADSPTPEGGSGRATTGH